MLNLLRQLYKNKYPILIIEREIFKEASPLLQLSKDSKSELPVSSKSSVIAAAIKVYLNKCQEKEKLIEEERKQFEMGKRYLAKMMGQDPETFDQDDIDESIRYLFPSGLFSPKAKPIMTDPSNIYLKKKPLECNNQGRPNDTLFYTGRPVFYSLIFEGVYLLEYLKSLEDDAYRNNKFDTKPIEMFNTKWMSQDQLSEYCLEKVDIYQYKSWITLMEAIFMHPYSCKANDFLIKMRVPMKGFVDVKDIPKPMVDPETGVKYCEAYGQKKWTMAELRLYMPGNGRITINDKSLLHAIPKLSNREAVLFPLQFTDTIGKVNIIAYVKDSGESSVALALRLAISRALSCFLPTEEVTRMRIAGLLSQDDRYKERKRPGQPKARKKPVWRKR